MGDEPPQAQPALEAFEGLVNESGRALAKQYGAHAIGVGPDITGGTKTGRLAVRFYFEPNFKASVKLPLTLRYQPEGADAIDLPTCAIYTDAVAFQRGG